MGTILGFPLSSSSSVSEVTRVSTFSSKSGWRILKAQRTIGIFDVAVYLVTGSIWSFRAFWSEVVGVRRNAKSWCLSVASSIVLVVVFGVTLCCCWPTWECRARIRKKTKAGGKSKLK